MGSHYLQLSPEKGSSGGREIHLSQSQHLQLPSTIGRPSHEKRHSGGHKIRFSQNQYLQLSPTKGHSAHGNHYNGGYEVHLGQSQHLQLPPTKEKSSHGKRHSAGHQIPLGVGQYLQTSPMSSSSARRQASCSPSTVVNVGSTTANRKAIEWLHDQARYAPHTPTKHHHVRSPQDSEDQALVLVRTKSASLDEDCQTVLHASDDRARPLPPAFHWQYDPSVLQVFSDLALTPDSTTNTSTAPEDLAAVTVVHIQPHILI